MFTSSRRLIGLVMIAVVMFAGNGCMYVTAGKVAMVVAKKIGEKTIEKMKEDKEKKNAEKARTPKSQPAQSELARR